MPGTPWSPGQVYEDLQEEEASDGGQGLDVSLETRTSVHRHHRDGLDDGQTDQTG